MNAGMIMQKKPSLIVVAGPTASGKTGCAIALAKRIDGEVVSADSMQIYLGMDILSAMPSKEEQDGIPHHMLGIADPAERFSAADYRAHAQPIVQDILSRNRRPVICGGTGLYIDALTKPMRFSEKSDEKLHAELMAMADEPGGTRRLHDELERIDPESAERLHPNDVRRVVRAIEIYRLTGITQTEQSLQDAKQNGDYNVHLYALEWPREVLYARISDRVDRMVEAGLVDEVRRLKDEAQSYPTAAQAIGYKEIAAALEGRMTMEDAIDKVKQATRNLAKRQITWFRRDSRTVWIPAQNRSCEEIAQDIIDRTGNDPE